MDLSRQRLQSSHNSLLNVWQSNYAELAAEVVSAVKVKNFLDLGANTGAVVEFLSSYLDSDTQITCFEPVRENFDFLKETVDRVGRSGSSTLIQKAVFYGKTTAVACGVGDNNTGGMFVDDVATEISATDHRRAIATSITFDCTTLERELTVPQIDLCKIDVEGSEWNILSNSSYVKERVDHILLEYHWKSKQETLEWLSVNLPSHEVFKIVSDTIWLRRR
jgi:FkbM family methyltransferase